MPGHAGRGVSSEARFGAIAGWFAFDPAVRATANGVCPLERVRGSDSKLVGWCGGPIQTGGREVILGGLLGQEKIWCPPNFGENPKTDSRYTVWILSVKYKIPVLLNSEFPGVPVQKIFVNKIQVEPTTADQQRALKSQMGRVTIVSGKLWTAIGPAEATRAVVKLTSIEPPHVLPPTCDGKLSRSTI